MFIVITRSACYGQTAIQNTTAGQLHGRFSVCQVHNRHGIESLFGVEPVRFDLLGPAPQVGRVHTKIPHIPLQSKLMVTP